MNEQLASALRPPPAPWVKDCFGQHFQAAPVWLTYIWEHFPETSIHDIFGKETGLEKEDFQALYVACWIYHPVVKGSYLLKIPDDVRDNVRAGFKSLSGRLSSHLHKEAKSAGGDSWDFLKGYHELLVQWEKTDEGEYLFLKCEGHSMFSWDHIKSWRHKEITGEGLNVNDELLSIARNDETDFGVSLRQAENYGKAYKKLLKTIGFKKRMKSQGPIVNVRQAAVELVTECRLMASMFGELGRFNRQLLRFGIIPDQPMGQHLSNSQVGGVFGVIADFARSYGYLNVRDEFMTALVAAEDDLRSIGYELKLDDRRGKKTTTRYFEEINVTPEQVNRGLRQAIQLLTRANPNGLRIAY